MEGREGKPRCGLRKGSFDSVAYSMLGFLPVAKQADDIWLLLPSRFSEIQPFRGHLTLLTISSC